MTVQKILSLRVSERTKQSIKNNGRSNFTSPVIMRELKIILFIIVSMNIDISILIAFFQVH